MTTREEAAAKAIYVHNKAEGIDGFPADEYDCCAKEALAAADAHDAANGVHRVSLDDATVERAARALDPKAWDEEAIMFIAHGQSPEDARASRQNYARADARRVLAAAVEAGQ